MPQYVIEREIPDAGQLTDEELRAVALPRVERERGQVREQPQGGLLRAKLPPDRNRLVERLASLVVLLEPVVRDATRVQRHGLPLPVPERAVLLERPPLYLLAEIGLSHGKHDGAQGKQRARTSRRSTSGGSILTATGRSSRMSRARYTSPMPPAPRRDSMR